MENCTVAVHPGYATPEMEVLLDSQLYLPEDGTNDPERQRKNSIPDDVQFQTKPQIALGLIDRGLGNGIQVAAWAFDELYGHDSKFLDGLDERNQAFVAEIPSDTRVWTSKPKMPRKAAKRRGRANKAPRVRRRPARSAI